MLKNIIYIRYFVNIRYSVSLSGQNKLSTDRVNGGDITLASELQFHLWYIFILKNKTFLRKVALNLSLTARVERTERANNL